MVLVRYVLKAAVRDRLVLAFIVMLLVIASLGIFLGSSAIAEQNQFAQVFVAASLRIAGVIGLSLFAVAHIRRSFESRDVEFLLSKPITRMEFVLSFSCAFSLVAIMIAVAQGICLAVLQGSVSLGFLLWLVSLTVENIIMVNTALFFSLFLSSTSVGVMATLGFYLLCRMIGEILGIIHAGMDMAGAKFLAIIMQLISIITPRLDLFGQTTWLVYGPGESMSYEFILAQGMIFVALLLIASIIDLNRKKF